MPSCDVVRNGKVWTYTPATHKTRHHGHARVIFLGPQAQQIVGEFLKPEIQAYIFSPADAEAGRREQQSKARKTPLHRGNRPGTNRRLRPQHEPGDKYTVASYRRVIARACDVAFPSPAPFGRLEDETGRQWRARLTPEQKGRVATMGEGAPLEPPPTTA